MPLREFHGSVYKRVQVVWYVRDYKVVVKPYRCLVPRVKWVPAVPPPQCWPLP